MLKVAVFLSTVAVAISVQCYDECTILTKMEEAGNSTNSLMPYVPAEEKNCAAETARICDGDNTCNSITVEATADVVMGQAPSFNGELAMKYTYCGEKEEDGYPLPEQQCTDWKEGIIEGFEDDEDVAVSNVAVTCGDIVGCSQDCGVDTAHLIQPPTPQCYEDWKITLLTTPGSGNPTSHMGSLTNVEKTYGTEFIKKCKSDEKCFEFDMNGSIQVTTSNDTDGNPVYTAGTAQFTSAQCLPADADAISEELCGKWNEAMTKEFATLDAMKDLVKDFEATCGAPTECADCVDSDLFLPRSAAKGVVSSAVIAVITALLL